MILIVDDKQENIFALKSILEMNNFEVDTALSGEKALLKILRNNYALVILDVQMPDMDGFEVAEIILSYSKSKDTPIIFLSAISKEKKFITKGYKSGAIDYITKPVDPDILLLKVASIYAMSAQKTALKRMQTELLQEIEARKISQTELALRNEELRTVMESMPLIAFTIGKTGEIEYTNEKWVEYLGETRQLPNLNPENKSNFPHWETSFMNEEEYCGEVKIKVSGSDAYRNFLLKIIPVKQNDSIIKWVGTFTDIEEQKLVNEILEQKVEERTSELLKKNIELEVSNRELQQVTWVLSHDLKEPVRKIITYANFIKDKYIGNNPEAQPHFNRIIESSERMADLIDDLLNFSRMPGSVVFQPIDLNRIVSQVLSEFEDEIENLQANVKVGNLPVIEGSPNQMRQLFQNLLSNAFKFAKPLQHPEIKIDAELVETCEFNSKAAVNGNFCRIKVADKGIGFDEKFLDKIFLVFQQLENKNLDGTGIGLAIVKKIVEKHNGIITANSTIDAGSEFIIVLPVKN
ncbi:MAG: response regulator [Bacteroidia bacterium]|nr:response regulator [Bacteroidia bacterium]